MKKKILIILIVIYIIIVGQSASCNCDQIPSSYLIKYKGISGLFGDKNRNDNILKKEDFYIDIEFNRNSELLSQLRQKNKYFSSAFSVYAFSCSEPRSILNYEDALSHLSVYRQEGNNNINITNYFRVVRNNITTHSENSSDTISLKNYSPEFSDYGGYYDDSRNNKIRIELVKTDSIPDFQPITFKVEVILESRKILGDVTHTANFNRIL